MPVILLKCPICKKEFEREKKEHNRSRRRGRASYCSRTCSGHAHTSNLGEHLGLGRPDNLVSGNRRDEYSPFKWFLKNVKQRNKDKNRKYDIDLEYLKNLWEKQKGICPFTNWQLELPNDSTNWNKDGDKLRRASLDRIDNSRGYIKGNLRYVSIMANYCRNKFTDQEVKLFCEAVTSYKKVNIRSQVE